MLKLLHSCNNLIESNILICFEESMKYLIERIELYYSAIPFRDANHFPLFLPQNLYAKRNKARKALLLKPEENVDKKNK